MRKHRLPVATTISFGIITLLGLLFSLDLVQPLLVWGTFLAAIALLLGVVNLFSVHFERFYKQRNIYSGVLALSMAAVFGLAITDAADITEGGVNSVFEWVQVPLEAALASLLAFFLLFAGIRLFKRRRNIGSLLFLITALLILLSNALAINSLLPLTIRNSLSQLQEMIQSIFVVAGIRGILIGVALGTIMISMRLLLGLDQPYNK